MQKRRANLRLGAKAVPETRESVSERSEEFLQISAFPSKNSEYRGKLLIGTFRLPFGMFLKREAVTPDELILFSAELHG